ncbi:double-strand-break repair protein rad21 homolog [Watersipora subatra]|uniref:double-strand-break repair protein rad21 homolog n=1 Tax=Watersipora subatra TaxID=2589382 RepID=UPI00355B7AFD
MFYAHFVLSKRGPLAKIWLAAHWEKKLTKAQVYETDIDSTVDAILEPKVKLALRTSGHLLLGVVRIYSRKTKYLLADCNEAFVKIKMAFRPGVVDLPDDHRDVAPSAITLQENFDDFNVNFNDFEMDTIADVAPKFAVNQSRPEEITIKEDVGHINFITDDGFGDVGFDDREMLREASSIEDSLFQTPAPIGDASTLAAADDSSKMDSTLANQEKMMANDGFGEDDDGALDDGLFGGPGLFEDISVDPPNISNIEAKPLDDDTLTDMPPPPAIENIEDEASTIGQASSIMAQTTASETTLLTNDDEAFALQPLDNTSIVTGVSGVSVERRPKRRRKLMVDEQKGIDSQSMKEQLIQTNDIVTTLDLAPPTLKLMHWKESGTVEKLFGLSGRHIPNKSLQKLYTRNLTVHVPQSIVEEEDKRSKRSRSPEPEQPRDQPNDTFAVPAVPDVSQVPEADNTPIPPEETPTSNDVPEPPTLEDETPRKRPRLDKTAKEAAEDKPKADEVDSGDEIEAPTLEEQENNIVAEESTGDEVEDKRLNRRTHTMLTTLGRQFDSSNTVSLLDMLKKNHSRKQAAAKFYTCLVLQKHSMVCLQQDEPFADIVISRGSSFVRSG